MQQMRTDTALLTKEEGGSPIRNPPTAAEQQATQTTRSMHCY
jgi:hypothetical protein